MNFDPLWQALEQFFTTLFDNTASNDWRLSAHDSRRIFHGRGDCYDGLNWCVVDVYEPVMVVTFFAPEPAHFVALLQDRLRDKLSDSLQAVVIKRRFAGRANELQVLLGKLPSSLTAQRGDLQFIVNLEAQNTGYFLDMEAGRRWLEERVQGKRVLNLFSYTCAFSVVAVHSGAANVVNVDMSKGALSRGRENHRLNDLSTDAVQFMPLNIMKSWSRIRKAGPYDIVIIDPPSYQKGSFIAAKDYVKLVQRIPEWLDQELDILACLNAPEMRFDFLKNLFAEHAPAAKHQCDLDAHPDFPDTDNQRRLKLSHFRVA